MTIDFRQLIQGNIAACYGYKEGILEASSSVYCTSLP